MLRPSYRLPNRRKLSTEILDNVEADVSHQMSKKAGAFSVVIVDGWKNTATNMQTVGCVLHNADGTRIFLDAYNFTEEEIPETGFHLNEKIKLCVEAAEAKYQTTIYAVVSDNARNMVSMGNLSSLWHSTCSSHTANLLFKEIVDVDLKDKVVKVVKQFRNTGPSQSIALHGGTRLKLPVETRWCTYRDMFACYLRNLQAMRNVVAENKFTKLITPDTIHAIYDENFNARIQGQIDLMDPICIIIQKCQSLDFSISEAFELWHDVQIPDEFKDYLEKRRNMAVNIYVLAANYLDPRFRGRKLSADQREEAEVFLIGELDGKGLISFQDFKENLNFFDTLNSKKIDSPVLYWKCASVKHKSLSTLAQKLLNIPASSAEIERVFSNWKFVHSPIRNQLHFSKSKKLVGVFYNLNILDRDSESESEDEL